ncbi:MAG: DNA polymerase III subunit delta [Deltaproteobacteria bacterium]|jgi:DNA polymerase-3 subunit delta|nr:DNA polymerase III subunit delta [Deltaproteobacteria bacterium]
MPGKRASFNLCAASDPVLLMEFIHGQLAATQINWHIRLFWGDDPLDNSFWEALTQQDLFQRPRAVVLRRAQNLLLEDLKKISAALGRVNTQIWPFICLETEFEKGRAKIPAALTRLQCCLFAKEKGWYKEIPPLDVRAKAAFIQKEAAALGLRPSREQMEQLTRALPQEAGPIRLEMEKLALASDPQGRPSPQAMQMLAQEPEMDVFAFLRGLQHGRQPEQIWLKFHKDSLNPQDAGLFGFLGLLLREARQLWQLLADEPVNLSPYVLESKKNLALSLGRGTLARIWDLALQADKGVKSGERDPKQAFEFLLAELFRLFNRKKL